MITSNEIYQAFLEEKAARMAAGFSMAGSLAIEDTAWMLDLSIADVCKAISVAEAKPRLGSGYGESREALNANTQIYLELK